MTCSHCSPHVQHFPSSNATEGSGHLDSICSLPQLGHFLGDVNLVGASRRPLGRCDGRPGCRSRCAPASPQLPPLLPLPQPPWRRPSCRPNAARNIALNPPSSKKNSSRTGPAATYLDRPVAQVHLFLCYPLKGHVLARRAPASGHEKSWRQFRRPLPRKWASRSC